MKNNSIFISSLVILIIFLTSCTFHTTLSVNSTPIHKFQVGDCLGLKDIFEKWENPDDYKRQILEIGKESYRTTFTNMFNANAKLSLSFSVANGMYEKVPCN